MTCPNYNYRILKAVTNFQQDMCWNVHHLFLFVLLLIIVNTNISVGLQTCCDPVEIILG